MLKATKFALVLASLCVGTAAGAAEYKEGEVIVKYKDGHFRTRTLMNNLYNAAGVTKTRRFSGMMEGYEHLILGDGVKVQDAISALMKDDSVEYAQPNFILRILPTQNVAKVAKAAGQPCLFPGIPFPPGCDDSGGGGGGGGGGGWPFPGDPGQPNPGPTGTPAPTPTDRPALKDAPAEVEPPVADPNLGKLYGMNKIGATDAWKINRGSKTMIVADIDTGIDYNHEDLAGNVWRNPNPTNGDVVGFDYVHNDGLPYDDQKHGSHTAGTIGAVGGNGIAISGVAQKVSIMSVKFLSGDGQGTSADAVRAIDYAIQHGARILSNSWGGKGDDGGNKALEDAIERARKADVLFVAAAGNDSTDNDGNDPSFPASFTNDNMVSVAATDEKDEMAFFSNYGKKTTHVAAPGANIYSTVPGNKYESLSGTSMACPHVAGAAALIWSAHPDWHYQQVKKLLMDTVDPLPALKGKTVTGGRINVLKALQQAHYY